MEPNSPLPWAVRYSLNPNSAILDSVFIKSDRQIHQIVMRGFNFSDAR